MTRPTLLFSTEAYEDLAAAMCDAGGYERGVLERRRFPDGERYRRIATDPDDRDVVVLGGTVDDVDTLELYDVCCALAKYGARRLSLVIPFFGYSTMERATKPGEVVTGKARARLFSSIPPAALGNRVFLVDLHVAGITHYFEGHITPHHIYAKPLVAAAVRELGGEDYVLASTDAGRAKWVESLASDLGVDVAFAYKRRVSGEESEVTGVSAKVEGGPVVIYDDMIRTGGSMIGAAEAYRDAGATEISAVATHGVFPGDALDRLRDSGVISRIVTTDTHPRARALASDFLRVDSVADLLVEHIGEAR